jgi:Transposase, Mutator family
MAPDARPAFLGAQNANVLNKLPKSQQPKAKRALQEIWMAETKKNALAAFDAFVETWGVKYDKALECLIKDRDAPQWPQPVAENHPRYKVHRRNRGRQIANSNRCRLSPSVTKIRR